MLGVKINSNEDTKVISFQKSFCCSLNAIEEKRVSMVFSFKVKQGRKYLYLS